MEECRRLYRCDECECETTNIKIVRDEQLCSFCVEKIHSSIVDRDLKCFVGIKMKEIQTSKGILKYRMPNILEAYDILEASGITTGNTSQLKLKRNIIGAMGDLVDFSGIEGITSYEQLLEDTADMIGPIGEIADEVIVKAFSAFKKKSS